MSKAVNPYLRKCSHEPRLKKWDHYPLNRFSRFTFSFDHEPDRFSFQSGVNLSIKTYIPSL